MNQRERKPSLIRQMNKQLKLNKQRLKGLYGKLIIRLFEINQPERFIEWKNVFEKLGRSFSINKGEIRELTFILRDLGFVNISCKGIKLNYEVIE